MNETERKYVFINAVMQGEIRLKPGCNPGFDLVQVGKRKLKYQRRLPFVAGEKYFKAVLGLLTGNFLISHLIKSDIILQSRFRY